MNITVSFERHCVYNAQFYIEAVEQAIDFGCEKQ
jgi:hypothetical protein